MLSVHEIRQVLKSGNRNKIAEAYKSVTGNSVNLNCGDCIQDARIVLQAHINDIERSQSPINLYLINPSPEVLSQNQEHPALTKVIPVQSAEEAFSLFEPDTVNIIAQDAFFDETLPVAKKIKPWEVYALDCYTWNGNGHATLERGNPGVWIFRGKSKFSSLSELKGHVSNPYTLVHAIRCAL